MEFVLTGKDAVLDILCFLLITVWKICSAFVISRYIIIFFLLREVVYEKYWIDGLLRHYSKVSYCKIGGGGLKGFEEAHSTK